MANEKCPARNRQEIQFVLYWVVALRFLPLPRGLLGREFTLEIPGSEYPPGAFSPYLGWKVMRAISSEQHITLLLKLPVALGRR